MNLYLSLLLMSLVCLTLQFEPFASLAAWQLTSIEHGQWWRILTGNFTHTNFPHLLMNLAALWLCGFIFKPQSRQLVLVSIGVSIFVGLCLLFSSLTSYVGLSGTLHGLFAFFALKEALEGRRSSWILFIAVIAKVTWEQTFGPAAETAQLINAKVAIQAHLAGMGTGTLTALANHLLSQHKSRKTAL